MREGWTSFNHLATVANNADQLHDLRAGFRQRLGFPFALATSWKCVGASWCKSVRIQLCVQRRDKDVCGSPAMEWFHHLHSRTLSRVTHSRLFRFDLNRFALVEFLPGDFLEVLSIGVSLNARWSGAESSGARLDCGW